MKVLFVNNLLPYPPNDGGRIRKYHLSRALSSDHDVTIIGAAPERSALEEYLRLHQGMRFLEIPYEPGSGRVPVREFLRNVLLAETFDAIHVAGFWQWPGDECFGRARVVVDAENIESVLLQRMWKVDESLVQPIDVAAIEALERRVFKRADLVLACSAFDADVITTMAPGTQVSVIPNGVDLGLFRFRPERKSADPPVLLYTGLLSYWPNADACRYFVREILPVLKSRIGPVVFRIAGRCPPAEVMALANGMEVEVIPDVSDIRPAMDEADVFVVPLRAGSGTRLKILEAFAVGMPVASTTVGCEGLGVVHGEHLLVADDPAEFAGAVETILTNTKAAREMALQGRRLAEERHGWDTIGKMLLDAYRTMLNNG